MTNAFQHILLDYYCDEECVILRIYQIIIIIAHDCRDILGCCCFQAEGAKLQGTGL
jgi:hypothetical protein